MIQQETIGTQFHLNRRTFLAGIGLSSVFFNVRGAFAEQLTLTPAQTEGPDYPDKLPVDQDNDLIIISDALTPAVGAVTWVSGRILDRNGQPVRGALVEIWQADNHGAYIHSNSPSANRDKFFQGYGRFVTSSSGRYLFRTVKPGLYPGRSRHIHFMVTYPGGQKLTTQLYVQGEPLNAGDGVLNGIRDVAARNSVVVPFAAVPDSRIGELSAVFDIVLRYTPNDSAAGPGPSIFAMNGVVHGASYQTGVAAGSWISIFGSNLGPGARTWNAATEIVNGKLPATLDGVSVTIDNQQAAVYYISPTQLNVEVPSNVSGTAQVKVTNAGGSASTSVSVQALKPGFFSYPQDYVAAVRSDGAYIGPANLMDGLVTVPAKPGDQVLLFGTAFGPTVPAIPAGEVVAASAPLANSVKIHIDTVDAVVGFAGLTSAGLYQFNVTVPDLPDGDHAVTAAVAEVWTQALVKLRIQR